MKPSDEQQIIIDNIKSGGNVMVDAVAGSGKSTTILFMAEQLIHKRILQITYNSALRLEIKQKIEEEDIQNVSVHTFHSLAVRYYMPTAFTDTELRNIMRNKTEPTNTIPSFDIIVLDEVQDMTKLYFLFIRKFLKDMLSNSGGDHTIQLLVLGDFMQGLYEFKGSDVRYLTFADKIWSSFPQLKREGFVKCSLKMSYRITDPMADFVNKVMLGETRLLSCKGGMPVVYIRNSRYQLRMVILSTIVRLLKEGNKPEDFFFLGPSMKTSIRKLENTLVEQKIPCYVPMFDKEKIDERVIGGKIVFSTFHSVKGRQRKFVFITGFDNKYFEFFGKDLDRKKCPNTLYVGCTRATHRLFLIETDGFADDKPLDFLKMNHLQMKKQPFIDFQGPMQMIQNVLKPEKPINGIVGKDVDKLHIHYITPTELIKFMSDSVLEELLPSLELFFKKISLPEQEVDLEIPVVIQTQRGFYEDVSDLNGIAIPCIYTDRFFSGYGANGANILYSLIENSLKEVKEGEYTFLREIFKTAPKEIKGVEDYLFLSNIFSALQEKLYFKLSQIQRNDEINEYNWLDTDTIEICMERLNNVIHHRLFVPEVEKTIINPNMEPENNMIHNILKEFFPKDKFIFTARIDMMCDDIWELKCSSTITIEHFLQTLIYAWIWRVIEPDEHRDFKIFNIKTGEIYLLEKSSLEDLTPLIVLILKSKYEKIKMKTDVDFLGQFAECD
jgi:hypothetical protein